MLIKESFFKKYAIFCATIVTLAGLFYVLCWHLDFSSLLIIPPSTWPIPYLASICLLLSGIALFFLIFPVRFPIVKILGAFILGLGLIRIIEISTDIDLGQKGFTLHLLSYTPELFSQMVLLGAINFSLIGWIILVWDKCKASILCSNVSIFILLTITFLSFIGFLSYFLPINFSFKWYEILPINCYIALPVSILGTGLISIRYYYDLVAKVNVSKGFPLVTALTITFCNFILIMGFKSEKEFLLSQIIDQTAYHIQTMISKSFKTDLGSLHRLDLRTEFKKTLSDIEWQEETNSIMSDIEEIKSIIWADPNLVVKNRAPAYLDSLFQLSMLSDQQQSELQDSLKRNNVYVTFTRDGSSNILLFSPAYWNNAIQGVLIYVIDAQKFFSLALEQLIDHDYILSIHSDDNTPIYSLNENMVTKKHWTVSQTIALNNLELSITLTPTQSFLNLHISNTFLNFMNIGGIFFAVSMGLLFHFKQIAQRKNQELDQNQKKLKKTLEDFNYTLTSTNIGTWEWDPKTNALFYDPIAQALLGVPIGTVNSFDAFLKCLHPDDREEVKMNLKRMPDKPTASYSNTIRVIWPNGSVHYISTKAHTIKDPETNISKVVGVCWDDTDIFSFQLLTQMSGEISRIFNESSTFLDAALKILPLIKNAWGWEILILWQLNEQNGHLECSYFVQDPMVHDSAFQKETNALTGKESHSIPWQVCDSHKALWYKDFTEEAKDPRIESAKKEGLHGSLASPIFEGNKLTGVLELFKKESAYEIPEKILNALMVIGIEIGQFLKKRAIETSKAELAEIVTYSTDAIYSCDMNGIILNWNKGAEKTYGWTSAEIIGQSIIKLYPPNQMQEFDKTRSQLMKKQTVSHFETQRLHKNGSLIWVNNTYWLILDEKNNPIRASVLSQDVTENKIADLALKKAEETFRDFVENTQEWIWEIDTDYRFRYSNPSIQKILGYCPEEIQGKQVFNFIADSDQEKAKHEIQQCVNKKQGWELRTLAWNHKNGVIHYLESNAKPFLDKQGILIGFRGADRDITEKMNLEKVKNEFISVASHELRTPLTSIHGALGLLHTDTTLPEKAKELLAIAYRNSERLTKLISDILDYEKLQIEASDKNYKKIDLAKVVEESIQATIPIAKQFQVEVIKEAILPNILVLAKPMQLLQVMLNLLSNAIKFSPPQGKVFISMQTTGKSVRVSIRDQGKGIPLEFRPRLFTRFAQADSSDARSRGGTGLGLSICKSIIQNLDGTINYESTVDKGSTFYFNLPIQNKELKNE